REGHLHPQTSGIHNPWPVSEDDTGPLSEGAPGERPAPLVYNWLEACRHAACPGRLISARQAPASPPAHAPRANADRISDVLGHAFRLVLELQHYTRPSVGDPVERDDAGVCSTAPTAAGDS